MTPPVNAGVRRLDPAICWPGGARIAVVFNIAYEGWSAGKAPGIGPMGNPLQPGHFDTNAHSWAEYGTVRGLPRLLDIADRHGVKTSVMVNGVLAERFPDVVRSIHARGHEIVAHSYAMDVIPVYLDRDAERENIRRTTRLIEEAAGVVPRGWISPRATASLATPELLIEAGYRWYGDCNDDDAPYLLESGNGSLVAIPLTMDVNDLPWSMRYGNAPRGLLEVFRDTLASMRNDTSGPMMLDVTAHAHVFGRPWGARIYEEAIGLVRGASDIWIATRRELADYVLQAMKVEGARREGEHR
jgi:peptidoglycan/xylan/chitin deacetylase (PgdA/CDA1 family)